MTVKTAFSCCLLALALPAGAQSYLDRLPDYIENTSVFEENQEPGRAFHLPAQSLSLNGTWKFGYYERPSEVPADFFKPAFNDWKWGTIEVPSNWEMQGYGQAVFRNVTTPFPLLPPKAMREQFLSALEQPGLPTGAREYFLSRLGGSVTPPPFSGGTGKVTSASPPEARA